MFLFSGSFLSFILRSVSKTDCSSSLRCRVSDFLRTQNGAQGSLLMYTYTLDEYSSLLSDIRLALEHISGSASKLGIVGTRSEPSHSTTAFGLRIITLVVTLAVNSSNSQSHT